MFSLFFNIHVPWSFFSEDCLIYQPNSYTNAINHGNEMKFYSKQAYNDSYYYKLIIFAFVFNFILPLCFLTVLNISVCVILFRKSIHGPQSSRADNFSVPRKILIKGIIICVVHLLCKGPSDLFNTVNLLYAQEYRAQDHYTIVVKTISQCLRRLDYFLLLLILCIWKIHSYCKERCFTSPVISQ